MANRCLLHKLMFTILCLALLISTGCRRGSSTPPASSGASAGSGSPTPTGLDGSWKATAAEFEGQPLVPLEGLGMMMGLDISGTQIKCKFQGIDAAEGTIQFDPKPQPNTVDIKLTVLRGRVGGQSVAGQTGEIRGICDLSGDRLRLCFFRAGSNAAQQGQRFGLAVRRGQFVTERLHPLRDAVAFSLPATHEHGHGGIDDAVDEGVQRGLGRIKPLRPEWNEGLTNVVSGR